MKTLSSCDSCLVCPPQPDNIPIIDKEIINFLILDLKKKVQAPTFRN